MTTWHRQLGCFSSFAIVLLITVIACTDGRIPKQAPVRVRRAAPDTRLDPAVEIQFNGQEMDVWQMQIRGNDMFLSGTPFGFMRWNVGANAENPQKTAAASDIIDQFAPFGKWVLDWYASGALVPMGRYVFTSGIVGVSIIDIAEPNIPVEIRRHPRENENALSEDVIQDEAFIYQAIVPHPTGTGVYGFREQDLAYLLAFDSRGLTPIKAFSYSADGQTVCCVDGATIWGNKIIVAFRSKLVWFNIESNGDLALAGQMDELQAVNVVSTPNYLYVQHEPNFDQPQGNANPRGIYVFDENGENIAFLQTVGTPRKFTVTDDDSHLFANIDGTKLEVFRIKWVR